MDLDRLEEQVPELGRMGVPGNAVLRLAHRQQRHAPCDWLRIAKIIGRALRGVRRLRGAARQRYHGLHGQRAQLSCWKNLGKPVILTGSQLPIGTIRTDAQGEPDHRDRDRRSQAMSTAQAVVPEVAVYFEYSLYRGNRTVKVHAERFEAFRSPNWPVLAEAGTH
jgi:hypothetical protein